MTELNLKPRELVSLYLHLEGSVSMDDDLVMQIQERISKKLCESLSIEQFEMLESLYKRGYHFSELQKS